MASLKLRRINLTDTDAAKHLQKFRDQLSDTGEVVTPAQAKLTKAVFGEALSPVRVAEKICQEVKARGLEAVLYYTEQFDKVKLDASSLRVSAAELAEAHAAADSELLETVRRVRMNILSFQTGILHSDAVLSVSGSHEVHLRYRPLKRVGIHVPGGAAAYPSTLLMTVVPAQAAGVNELAVVMPPKPTGAYSPQMLAVCAELGVSEVYRVGGAQAIAALAYGVKGLPAVDKIVGPGNQFVALAKKVVSGHVGIDCVAGPSEVVVVADELANADFIACDLIAQAEHAPGVAVLVTWSEALADDVTTALEKRLKGLARADVTRECLERYGVVILTADADQAVDVVNQLAPEHLHIQTRDPEATAEQMTNAGAIFLGPYTPVAIGDYAAGPSHVLPTGGTARFSSGLTANDFLRRTSVMSFTRYGLRDIAEDVLTLANVEGLTGHALSVDARLAEISSPTVRTPRKPVPKPAPKPTEKVEKSRR